MLVLPSVIVSAAVANVCYLKTCNTPKLRPLFAQRLSSLVCHCHVNETSNITSAKGFSALSRHIPWNRSSTWTTMALYMFILQIPLGVCGLSIVAYVVHMPVLDHQTEAISLLLIQVAELVGIIYLLQSTSESKSKLIKFFKRQDSKERSWILATILPLGPLLLLVFLSSLLLDGLFQFKEITDPFLKDMISSSNIAKSAVVIVYCLVTPLAEELIYRGFLLSSLASTNSWQMAVLLSSLAFSVAHFSTENFVQLFIIGSVLGCCYCWTGNLVSSFALHSLYNALTLILSLFS